MRFLESKYARHFDESRGAVSGLYRMVSAYFHTHSCCSSFVEHLAYGFQLQTGQTAVSLRLLALTEYGLLFVCRNESGVYDGRAVPHQLDVNAGREAAQDFSISRVRPLVLHPGSSTPSHSTSNRELYKFLTLLSGGLPFFTRIPRHTSHTAMQVRNRQLRYGIPPFLFSFKKKKKCASKYSQNPMYKSLHRGIMRVPTKVKSRNAYLQTSLMLSSPHLHRSKAFSSPF